MAELNLPQKVFIIHLHSQIQMKEVQNENILPTYRHI